MRRFASDKLFAFWLGLCPVTKITGGKVTSGKTKRCANHAAQALRMAAAVLRSGNSALGDKYRRIYARIDRDSAKAVTAVAHKLARLIYPMLTKGEEYPDLGQGYFAESFRQRVLHNLAQRAKTLGMRLVPSENPVFKHHENQSVRWCCLREPNPEDRLIISCATLMWNRMVTFILESIFLFAFRWRKQLFFLPTR